MYHKDGFKVYQIMLVLHTSTYTVCIFFPMHNVQLLKENEELKQVNVHVHVYMCMYMCMYL